MDSEQMSALCDGCDRPVFEVGSYSIAPRTGEACAKLLCRQCAALYRLAGICTCKRDPVPTECGRGWTAPGHHHETCVRIIAIRALGKDPGNTQP